MKTKFGWIALALLVTVNALCPAQQPAKLTASSAKGAPASPSLLEKAEQARKTGDLPTAIRLFKQAIVAAPDKEEAYRGLWVAIYHSELARLRGKARAAEPEVTTTQPSTTHPSATQPSTTRGSGDSFEMNKQADLARNVKLTEIYRGLVTSHPRVTAYRYELAMAEHSKDGKLPAELEKIIAADPKFAPALESLGDHASATGDIAKEREYWRRASLVKPDEARYAYFYLSTFKMRDRKEHRRLVEEFVARYPKSRLVSNALEDAAADADTPEDRIALLERMASGSETAYIPNLLAAYAQTDVHKAADLAQEKLNVARKSKDPIVRNEAEDLTKTADYYNGIARAQDLLKAGNFAEARVTLEKVSPTDDSRLLSPITFPRTKIQADLLVAEGKMPEAYKFLLGDRETIADAVQSALAVKLGGQLGKSESQVTQEIISAVLERAKQPEDFELENLTGGGKTKLSSFRGKFVLVNFWSPT